MSTYVMADIHGCSEQYRKMLKKIGFSGNDELYIIGDVIDRGPDGADLLWEVMHTGNIHMLMGNHEIMMLDYLLNNMRASLWSSEFGKPTVRGLKALGGEKVLELTKLVMTCPFNMEITVGDSLFELVHACPSFMCRERSDMLWNGVDPDEVKCDDRTVIFGHTPTNLLKENDYMPVIYRAAHAFDIDCGCVYGGALACLRLDDMKEFYVRGPLSVSEYCY